MNTTLTIKKDLLPSEAPWIVFNEHGRAVARFAEREDAGEFLYETEDDAQEEREDKIACLERIINGEGAGFSNDELLALGIGYGIPGPLSDEQMSVEVLRALND